MKTWVVSIDTSVPVYLHLRSQIEEKKLKLCSKLSFTANSVNECSKLRNIFLVLVIEQQFKS
jgi:hypothetical protein